MSIKVTAPNEMGDDTSKIYLVIHAFEHQLRKAAKNENYYHLVIPGEYSRKLCDAVEVAYTDAGWVNVQCRTSSENGERPGLTGLILHRP